MLCSAGRLHDHTPGTLHRAALCITLGMLTELFPAGRAVLTSESLPAVVAYSNDQSVKAGTGRSEVAFDERIEDFRQRGLLFGLIGGLQQRRLV